jgi:hypothetical protein
LIGNGSTERMTAANGCVEEWSDMPGAATGNTPIQGGNFFTGFVNINVISGEQYGCTSQPQVQVGVRRQGSRHTLTARSSDATWELYGDF